MNLVDLVPPPPLNTGWFGSSEPLLLHLFRQQRTLKSSKAQLLDAFIRQ